MAEEQFEFTYDYALWAGLSPEAIKEFFMGFSDEDLRTIRKHRYLGWEYVNEVLNDDQYWFLKMKTLINTLSKPPVGIYDVIKLTPGVEQGIEFKVSCARLTRYASYIKDKKLLKSLILPKHLKIQIKI